MLIRRDDRTAWIFSSSILPLFVRTLTQPPCAPELVRAVGVPTRVHEQSQRKSLKLMVLLGADREVWKELAELLGQSSELLAGTSSAELLRMIYPPEAEDGGGNAFDDSPGATG